MADIKKLSALSLLPLTLLPARAQQRQPNIIYIMADDLGIGDLGCYGQMQIKTPNIDSIAADGLLFTNHYTGSTVSAPSRCSLMTGLHTGHCSVRGNKGVKDPVLGIDFDWPLSPSETTVAEILKENHYTTALVGKWGLGGPSSDAQPNKRGFDYFFGYLGQGLAHSYYPEFLWENENQIMLNHEVYSHDLIMEKALSFIRDNADKPFFLYLAPTIPHADLIVPEGELGEYDGMFVETPFVPKNPGGYTAQPKPRATYAAMVSRLDRGVGDILSLLKEKGIDDNTIVIFTSDNGVHAEGGHDPEFFDSNSSFRGIKRDLYDGGVHTPFVLRWKGVVAPGTTTDHIAAFWDFLPTVCEIIGVRPPKGLDGISYLSSITGKGKQKEHRFLYYEFHERNGRRCIIKDGWKLVELRVNVPRKTTLELYNLADDPEEEHNLIEEYPGRAAKLKKLMYASRTESPVWNFDPAAGKP